MRFISLVSSEEQDRKRSGFALPVSLLSSKAGLPVWMADLRNDIAHGTIPSFEFLLEAHSWALAWLISFWNSNLICESSHLEGVRSTISDTNRILQSYFGSQDLPPSLSTEDMEGAVSDPSVSTYFIKLLITRYAVSYVEESVSTNGTFSFNHASLRTWGPILRFLRNVELTSELVLYSILAMTAESYMHLWSHEWLLAFKCYVSGSGHPLVKYLSKSTIESFDFRRALRHLIDVLTEKTFPSLLALLDVFHPTLSLDRRDRIVSACNTCLLIDDPDKDNHPPIDAASELSWPLDDTKVWADIPLGHAFGV
ncbi:unnamed protein product [Protopolystoma xenopodis]|uniref:Uncharacterized protein n=1 Tax=Protopolystoma xenopodis TaxID=117903 RepID=A0A3S4ZF01_9PLAT|nr:unnamed protein product [Protopolystoma xenopodis]